MLHKRTHTLVLGAQSACDYQVNGLSVTQLQYRSKSMRILTRMSQLYPLQWAKSVLSSWIQKNSLNSALLIVQHLRKVVQSPKVLPSLTSGAHNDSVTHVWLSWSYWVHLATMMATKDSKMNKHGIAGKKNCVTWMISQKPEIIRRSEFGKKNWREYMAPYITGLLIMI
jgi:hypothetical protein